MLCFKEERPSCSPRVTPDKAGVVLRSTEKPREHGCTLALCEEADGAAGGR